MNQAICIAAERFADSNIAPLNFAVNDARAIGEVLADRYGYAVRFVLQPTASEVYEAFDRALSALQPGDKLVTFFAGHSVSADRDQLLLACDARPRLADEAGVAAVPGMVSLRALTHLARHRAPQHLVVLDCCRAPQLAGDGISRGDGSMRPARSDDLVLRDFVLRRPGKAGEASLETVLSAANLNGSRAIELASRQHGLFTWALKQLLDVGPAEARQMQVDGDFLARLTDTIRQELIVTAPHIPAPDVQPALEGPIFRFV